MTRDKIKEKLTAILRDTDEQHPMKCSVLLGEESKVTGKIPEITGAFRESDGTIWFNIKNEEPKEYGDMFKIDLEMVLEELKTLNKKKYAKLFQVYD